ncbi:hypothetical protein [Psittacicella hinzii]|uniref:Uncharacterized protein n=1 Tax=Psittacicella hinzii TaxID=2028575 RepID=A0A3A1YGI9_9GAMM|nr:hypothetical protein [Psittacicella hinzii]RIY36190.1 hypothetical protein CKF58_06165 [Psittacicella hinzii]
MVNAELALRGPAAFLSDNNFIADMDLHSVNNHNMRYAFRNNIYGPGGLEVYGKYSNLLYLIGNQSYTGETIVHSGNFVFSKDMHTSRSIIEDAANAYADNATINTPQISVSKGGGLYLVRVNANKIVNNGELRTINSKINELVLGKDSNLQVYLSLFKCQLTGIKVTGTAKLDGTYFARLQEETYVPTTEEQEVAILTADKGITGDITFKPKRIEEGRSNRYVTIQASDRKYANNLYVIVKRKSGTQAARSVASSLNLTAADANILSIGGQQTDNIFIQANKNLAASANSQTASNDLQSSNVNSTIAVNQQNREDSAQKATTAYTLYGKSQTNAVTLTADEQAQSSNSSSDQDQIQAANTTDEQSSDAVVTLATRIQNAQDSELLDLYATNSEYSIVIYRLQLMTQLVNKT